MRETSVEIKLTGVGARNGVENQTCKDDPDPPRRNQPQLWPDQPERERHRRACEQQIDRPAGRVDHCDPPRSEEHTSELQSLMRISYAVFCLKTKKKTLT